MPVAAASRSSSSAVAAKTKTKSKTAAANGLEARPAMSTEASTLLLSMQASIPPHFQQAQHSLANHRKNIVSLHRIHLKASAVTEETPKGTRLLGEKIFNEVFVGCLNRILPIKKGVSNADRVCKFVAAYAIYVQEQFRLQARAEKEKQRQSSQGEVEEDEDEDEEDTTATRFVHLLMKHLLKGFAAKDKNVRLRCCGCVALLINGIESIDEKLFRTLRSYLLARAKDKESAVRVQAIIALSKMQAPEDDEEEDQELGEVRQVILDTLRFDPSAEVRRAALFNITTTEESRPFVLERLRDVDPINRRCVYLGSLSMMLQGQTKALQESSASAQPGPSRLGLDVDAAGEVVRLGMGEREPSVKRAAKKLVISWFEACGFDLIVFLNQFDVVASKHTEAALLTIFEARPAIVNQVSFDADEFWANLSPSTAFLARVFVDYFKRTNNDRKLEECLPMVTALAFRIQKEFEELGKLIEQYGTLANSALVPEEEQQIALFTIRNKTFVVSQLLGIALSSDYGDEIGRRKMFGLVRDMISDADLPEDLVPSCLDVLLKLSNDQRDFMRVIVEIVQVLGNEEDDETFVEDHEEADDTLSLDGTPLARKKARKSIKAKDAGASVSELAIEHRRLIIVRAMLERTVGTLQENTAFHGLIPQLIAPAVRSKDPSIREEGLVCMGLCALLDPKLAVETFPLLMQQAQNGEGQIKLRAVQAVIDICLMHGIAHICSKNSAGIEVASQQFLWILISLLEDEEPSVQSVAAEGLAKFLLTNMVADDDALKALVLIYMSPESHQNQELRQCLSYFLPVYCGSSSWNQRRLQRVFVPVLQALTEFYNDRGEDQEMVNPLQIGLQLLDWTDPDKVVMVPGRPRDETVHVDVAVDLIKALYTTDEKDERKVACQLLAKVYLPETLEDTKVQEVLILLTGLKMLNPVEETVSKNALGRFETAFVKAYPEQVGAGVANIDAHNTPALEGVKSFFEEIQTDVDDVLAFYSKAPKIGSSSAAGRKSAAKTATSVTKSTSGKRGSNNRDESGEEEDDDDEEEEEEGDDE